MSEDKNEKALTMCATAGFLIIGELVGGNKLLEPRIVQTFEEDEIDPATGKKIPVPKIRMTPLPGIPPYLILKNDGFTYPVPKDDPFINGLYRKVTKKRTMEAIPNETGILN